MCDILRDISQVVPGKSASVLAEKPLHHLLQCFSRVAAGSLGFLLSCDRNLREPLVLLQGSQASY